MSHDHDSTSTTTTREYKDLKDLVLKKFAELNDNIKKNQEFMLQELKKVDDKATEAIALAKSNEERTKNVEFEMDKMKKTIEMLQSKVNVLEDDLDDQTNRNMRSTLVVRGIAQDSDNESWEKTTDILSSKINEITEGQISVVEVKSFIERAHRIKGELHRGSSGKPIIVKFNSWKSSELVKKSITNYARLKGGTIFVSQLYSKRINDRQYQARQYRKELFRENPDQNIFIQNPARLMGKKKGSAEKYRLLKSF